MQYETNVKKLIKHCQEEMESRNYSEDYKGRCSRAWGNLVKWMDDRNETVFTATIGNAFLDEKVGTHMPGQQLIKSQRVCVRSVRMLISTQNNGAIEDMVPLTEHIFEGELGELITEYLDYMRNTLGRKKSTVDGAEYYLYLLYCYLTSHGLELESIDFDVIENFHKEQGYSLSTLHSCAGIIRRFLKYIYESSKSDSNYSVYVVKDNYRIRESKLPSIYSEDEIRSVLSSVDRSSKIGKRDYLVLILAAEYGWRNGDIRQFRLDYIDWDKNEIRFCQQKTGYPVSYPLTSSVGNAIIDYVRNGRPLTDAPEVILSVKSSRQAKPLSEGAISTIAARYIGKSGLNAVVTRHSGTHSFRHSLATNMLSKDISLPIISGVLGHRSTETTMTYLKVDFNRLRKCALPMPKNNSPFYQRGGIWL